MLRQVAADRSEAPGCICWKVTFSQSYSSLNPPTCFNERKMFDRASKTAARGRGGGFTGAVTRCTQPLFQFRDNLESPIQLRSMMLDPPGPPSHCCRKRPRTLLSVLEANGYEETVLAKHGKKNA